MRILVTGGAGYVGTELVERLAVNPRVKEIVVYDNLARTCYGLFLGSRLKGGSHIRFVRGEILDSRGLRQAMQGMDVVYHLAANVATPFANTDPHFFEQINHWGTAEVVEAVESTGVRRLIYASSMAVYGAPDHMVDESTPPNPATYYGISKLRGETHVERLFDKVSAYVLRLGNVYGYSRSMRFDAVVNHFVFDANFVGRISIQGTGLQSRPFFRIASVGNVLEQLAFADLPSGTYNAFDAMHSVLDVAETLKDLLPELEFLFVNQHLSMRDLRADPQFALRNLLDWPPLTGLREELSDFVTRLAF